MVHYYGFDPAENLRGILELKHFVYNTSILKEHQKVSALAALPRQEFIGRLLRGNLSPSSCLRRYRVYERDRHNNSLQYTNFKVVPC